MRQHLIARARTLIAVATAVAVCLSIATADAVRAGSATRTHQRVAPAPATLAVAPTLPVRPARRTARVRRPSRPRRQVSRAPARKRPRTRHRSRHRLTRRQRLSFTWPVRHEITSRFGRRRSGFHHGMDIACARGERLRASKGGRVVWAGRAPVYGRTVVIRHRRGFTTLYGHMSSIGVWNGQQLRRRAAIGRCGSSGRSTGPHVHFEIRRWGRHHNPRPYLR